MALAPRRVDTSKDSWLECAYCYMICLAFGPTCFMMGVGIIALIFAILPFWAALAFFAVYYADVLLFKAHKRPQSRMMMWARKHPWWRKLDTWFGQTVIWDAGYDADKNAMDVKRTYVIGLHPHGVYAWGNGIVHTETPGPRTLAGRFPGFKGCFAAASVLFHVPWIREVSLLLGCVDADRKTLTRTLKGGWSVAINIDGEGGALATRPGEDSVVLENRKGFVRLALATGSPMIPMYVFGLNDVYTTPFQSLLRPVQLFFHKNFKLALPIFFSRYGLAPDRVKLTTVVGLPIDVPKLTPETFGTKPDPKDVDLYHAKYVAAMRKLFDDHKEQLGFGDRELKVLDAHKPY